MEEGTLQVRKPGWAVNITLETFTESNWWSFRLAYRNEAVARMCLNLDIEYEAVSEEEAANMKDSRGESLQGMRLRCTSSASRNGEHKKKPSNPSAVKRTTGQDATQTKTTTHGVKDPDAEPTDFTSVSRRI